MWYSALEAGVLTLSVLLRVNYRAVDDMVLTVGTEDSVIISN
jgi:hypothetical protein